MIPVRLSLFGLYSYREKVEIDFGRLIDASIFGIFGRVGEGKSALLEAMTYSIYGEAERLNAKENRGYNMMNLNSDEMNIEFEFKTGQPARLFKAAVYARRNKKKHEEVRTPEWSAYEMKSGEWEPIEHKSLKEVIGLSYENFRRTVIIPQDKFKEFLHLKPAERTGMLKELFGLEKYDLWSNTKIVENKNQAEINKLSGALGQLEAVTDEALQQAQTEWSEAEEKKKELQEKADILQEAVSSQKSLEESFTALARAREKFTILNEKTGYYDGLKREIERATIALTRFSGLITIKKDLDSAYARLTEESERTGQEISGLVKEIQAAEKKMLILRNAYEQRDELLTKVEDLKRLCSIEELEVALSEDQKKLTKSHSVVTALEKEFDTLAQHEKVLKKSIQELQVKLPEADQIQALSKWMQEFLLKQSRCNDLDKTIKEIKQDIQNHYINFKSKVEKSDHTNLQGQLWYEKLKAIDSKDTIARNQKKLESEILLTQDEIEASRIYEQKTALYLALQEEAERLVDGVPCPVCGSTDHPGHPDGVSFSSVNKFASAGDLKGLQKYLNQLQDILSNLRTLDTITDDLSIRLTNFEKQKSAIESEILVLKKGYAWNDVCKPDIGAYEGKKIEIERKQNQLSLYSREIEKIRTDLDFKRTEKDHQAHDLQERKIRVEANITKIEVIESQIRSSLSVKERNNYRKRGVSGLLDEVCLLETKVAEDEKNFRALEAELKELVLEKSKLEGARDNIIQEQQKTKAKQDSSFEKLRVELQCSPFDSIDQVERVLLKTSEELLKEQDRELKSFWSDYTVVQEQIKDLESKTNGLSFNQKEYRKDCSDLELLSAKVKEYVEQCGVQKEKYRELQRSISRKAELQHSIETYQERAANIATLKTLFNSSGFVKFISSVYLQDLCSNANERFYPLTRRQYKIEVGDQNEFLIRDFLNGGRLRLAKTISGGESFQASLCLALALSESIQLNSGMSQDFFFLDEGFGALDQDSLQAVLKTLNYLRKENRAVGVISHVEELRQNIDVFIEVRKSLDKGSQIFFSYER